MELDQIKAIIAMMKENDLTEFSMEQNGLKIRIKRGPEGIQQTVSLPPPAPTTPNPVAAAAPEKSEVSPSPPAEGIKHVVSPMVGTFYRSASPDAPPYVEVGQEVTEDTVVCIIEAMKVMNEIKAEVRGIVTDVMIDNARPVEFGQKLFAVRAK